MDTLIPAEPLQYIVNRFTFIESDCGSGKNHTTGRHHLRQKATACLPWVCTAYIQAENTEIACARGWFSIMEKPITKPKYRKFTKG